MGSTRVRIAIVALIAAGVLIPGVLILTQQRAAGADMILSIIDGTADVARGPAEFTRAGDGQVLNAGDRVRTADQSHAVVTFFDGSTMELEPATTITVVQATASPTGAITIQIQQAIGRTWSAVQQLTRADSKFEIRTPSTTATVRGTGFVTEVTASGATTVTTTDGLVEVNAQGQTVVVPAGTFTTVPAGGPPSPPQTNPMARNTLRFGLHSPAHLVVIDPLGRTCGVVPAGPTLIRQIPGCLVTEAGIAPQLIDLPNATPGTYSIAIETIAPGGDFVATASAIASARNLSFNYTVTGGGPPGTRFGSTLKVESGPNDTLTASGLSTLVLIDRAPTRVVPSWPRSVASGSPNTSLFPPLPRFGFTTGVEVTPPPSGRTPAPTALASPTASPTATDVAVPEPTQVQAPTVAPTRAPAPPIPTATLAPTPIPSPPTTPSPTPTPSPAPSGPKLVGGVASPGSSTIITGHGWSTALITLSWEDGRPLVQLNADASGDFTVAVVVLINTNVGTYRITASDSRLTAAGQVTVYAPAFTVSCSSTTSLVSVNGNGWPPSSRYAIRSSLLTTSLIGAVAADGTFSASFMPPSGVLPGDYQVTATAGSLLAEAQGCTLR